MPDPGATQRYYRAPCPGCGAPVEFRSAQSTHAVCAYCQSTVVRQGDTLARLGRMAELFDDFSPLQLGTAGRYRNLPFTLVGRLQYSYGGGRWTEWIAAFDDGHDAILSEDNGAYVFAEPAKGQGATPPPEDLRIGARTAFSGQDYTVTSNEQVALVAAQGELPHLPPLGQRFAMAELRSDTGEVLSLDYGSTPPAAWSGHAVQLEGLALAGLRGESAKNDPGRAFNCPHCGAPIAVKLENSKSITCSACRAIIDLSDGVGGQLRHALQDESHELLIPLGSTGQLQGAQWQVVGFQHRVGQASDDDEAFGWEEYLLYNRQRGFAFLVDAEDGWSLVRPTTGAPTLAANGQFAQYQGRRYQLQYAYDAQTTYVAGEFYWQVARGQKSINRDFAAGGSVLSMERTPEELSWSSGLRLNSAKVAEAFKLDEHKALFRRADAAPLSSPGASGFAPGAMGPIIIAVLIILFVLIMLSVDGTSSGSSSGSGSSYGSSYGGYSSGGGHK